MQSLGTLWAVLAKEIGEKCSVSTALDVNTVKRRSKGEGFSFMTITLPAFGNDFDRSLDNGAIAPTAFPGFTRRGGLPLFLGGFLERIFDRTTGVLLDDPDVSCVLAVRQLCRIFSKVNLPCAEWRRRAAFSGYVQTESDLRAVEDSWAEGDLRPLSSVFNQLFHHVLADADSAVRHGHVYPKHGPGATADRLVGNEKFDLTYWTWRLEQVFPYSDYTVPSARHVGWMDARVELADPEQEIPVRVIDVPKTLKSPRIIAIEPTAMQYMQQGIADLLVSGLRRDGIAAMFVDIQDQTPNQRYARMGSVTGSLATLDLSEASDRLSNQLVKRLLMPYGNLYKAVQATRSLRADVPGHGVIPLAKFASMGSGLTFVVETMVFLAIVMDAIRLCLGRRLTPSDLSVISESVQVFGDDMVVPAQFADAISDRLELFGFKVNRGKSFSEGHFRESCGKDYFLGHDVSVVKARELFPASRAESGRIAATVSFRNQLASAGWETTARWLDRVVERVLPRFPIGDPRCGALVRTPLLGEEITFERMSPSTHEGQVKAYVLKSQPREIPLDGVGALHKCLSKRGSEPFQDRQHLFYSGRPVVVDTKPRWISPVYRGPDC